MLSIKIFFFMTLISLACLLPGKKGKMYLVDVESEKKSANSVPGSKLNARPRMQSKALNVDVDYLKIEGGVLYTSPSEFNTSCIYRVSSKTVYTWFLPFFSSKSNPILTSRVSFEN